MWAVKVEKWRKVFQLASYCSNEQAGHCIAGTGRTAETLNGAQLNGGKIKIDRPVMELRGGWEQQIVYWGFVELYGPWAALYPCQIGKEKCPERRDGFQLFMDLTLLEICLTGNTGWLTKRGEDQHVHSAVLHCAIYCALSTFLNWHSAALHSVSCCWSMSLYEPRVDVHSCVLGALVQSVRQHCSWRQQATPKRRSVITNNDGVVFLRM